MEPGATLEFKILCLYRVHQRDNVIRFEFCLITKNPPFLSFYELVVLSTSIRTLWYAVLTHLENGYINWLHSLLYLPMGNCTLLIVRFLVCLLKLLLSLKLLELHVLSRKIFYIVLVTDHETLGHFVRFSFISSDVNVFFLIICLLGVMW